MSPRNRKFSRKKNKLKYLAYNIGISFLFIIVIGFIISGIDRLFYNDGINVQFPDLSTLLTQTEYEKRTGHKIEIEIWNGCGIPNLANIYGNFLRSEGIDVMDSKNAANFNYTESTILHHRGEIERALALAKIMMIDKNNIVENKNENLFFDLTLIIGKDYDNLLSYRNAIMHQVPF